MNATDRRAVENAAHVLRALCNRAETNPEFARHLEYLSVPQGLPISHFANALAAVAVRHPTKIRALERRD